MARYEALLLRRGSRLVRDRNGHLAPVVSRQDNHAIFKMGWELKHMARRIETGYKDED